MTKILHFLNTGIRCLSTYSNKYCYYWLLAHSFFGSYPFYPVTSFFYLFSFSRSWTCLEFSSPLLTHYCGCDSTSTHVEFHHGWARESHWKRLAVFPSSVFVKTVGSVCFTGYISLTHRTLPPHISTRITIISEVSATLRAVICHSPSFALKSPNLTPADSLCCLPN